MGRAFHSECLITASEYFTNTISINLKNGTPFNEFWSQIVSILIIMGVFYAAGLLASFAWNYTMAIVTQRFQNDLRKTYTSKNNTIPKNK